MSTIPADPLALMLRGDAVAGPVAVPVAGEGADFALALADVMAAGLAPAAEDVSVGAMPVAALPVQADAAAMGPLEVLQGLGRIALPPAAVAATVKGGAGAAVVTVAEGDGPGVLDDAVVVPAVPGRKGVEVVPAAVQGVDPALVGGTVAPGAEDAGVAPAPATVATAEPVTDDEDVPVEGNAGAPAEDGEVPVDEVPVDEVAEAVTVAVAAVIAVPMAAATGTAVAEAPRQDAAAEVVRLAGAAPLMLLPVKDRKAEAVPPEKGLPTDAAEGEGDGEGVKFLKDDKDKGAETKVMARAAPVAPEVVAKPLPDRRAVPSAPVAEAVRGMDGAPAAAPQMQAAQPLMAQPLAPAPVAMDRPGWETALTEHIAAELSQDGQQIELDLSPERLGGLKITLEITDGQAQVRFVTETPEAARLIQQNEHRLSESLSRAGLSLGGHESASRDAQQQQGDRSGRGAPRGVDIAVQRPAEPRPGMISGRVGSGLVNLIA